MSAEMPDRPGDALNDRVLRSILISNCCLSTEEVEHISNSAHELGISFARAAIQLGIVSEEELADALEWAQRFSGERVGPVEAAVRRVSTVGRRTGINTSGIERRAASQIVIAREPYNAHAEKIRALRTELLQIAQAPNRACVFAVISPYRQDGRSQLVAEIAIAFAQLGRNTLLVDADLRHPRQQELFEGPHDALGLAHALAQQTLPPVHPVEGLSNLYVLPAGDLPLNPLELLSTHHFRRLMTEWRNNYDFVIIDTPPVADSADALAVAEVAESAVVVSRAKQTTYRGFKNMLRRLATADARVLGAVIGHF